MAVKKFIIKQTTNWNSLGEKTGTHTVVCDEADIGLYLVGLDGKIEVYEQNLTLSSADTQTTASTSPAIVDYFSIKSTVAKGLYISNSNKRPIVFKNVGSLNTVVSNLKAIKPFAAPFDTELPSDVSYDYGNAKLM